MRRRCSAIGRTIGRYRAPRAGAPPARHFGCGPDRSTHFKVRAERLCSVLSCGSGSVTDSNKPRAGLEAAFLENRRRLLRFLVARGAGETADDLLQELWIKIAASRGGPIASPLPYLFRMADLLMIDRYRASRQARLRDEQWHEVSHGFARGVCDGPSVERQVIGREHMQLVAETLAGLGPRVETAFRRYRVDGVTQRHVARELGVSLSTVESDLRRAYAALAHLRERLDEV